MQVLVNNSVYEMSPAQAQRLISFAKEQVPNGIYAVAKGDYIELRKDELTNPVEQITEWEEQGFEVYANI